VENAETIAHNQTGPVPETGRVTDRLLRLLENDPHVEKISLLVIMGVGIGLRVVQYLGNRSLWGDEVAIALNLRMRSLAGLLHPLSYDQTMPIGLLLVLKLVGSAFGFSELVLRSPLLLAGCGLIAVSWILFSKIFERRVVLLTLALMGVADPLIYYSAEVKQYGLDALVTVLLMFLGVTTLRGTTDRGWRRLIVGGAVALFFCQPAVFVLASIGIAAALDPRFRSSGKWREYCLLAAAVWLLVFGTLFWFSYRSTTQNPFMQAFWSPRFIHLESADFRSDLSTALGLLLGAAQVVLAPSLILGGLFLAGLVGIRRKQGALIALMAAGPFALLLLAAGLKQYPIVVRLVLFYAPILLWIYASGISAIADLVPEKFSTLAFIVFACVFIAPTLRQAAWQALHFNQHEATRDMVRKMEGGNEVTPVYLVFGKYLQWAYYAGDWSHPELLRQRIQLAYRCLRSAQLGHVRGPDERASDCVNLDFPAREGRPEEIVGNPPPGPRMGPEADDRWAAEDAARIAGLKSRSVWLFLPAYGDHSIDGFPKRRKLLEKLDAQLQRDGCRLLETDIRAESVAHRVKCSAGDVPVVGRTAARPLPTTLTRTR
jgi:hypothetical protein